jgi:hypothetical protein
MEQPQSRFSLLEEVERRQDEVIAQLDELNARVEAILAEWTRAEKMISDTDSEMTPPLPVRSIRAA